MSIAGLIEKELFHIIRVPRLIQALTITGMHADTAKNGDLIILVSFEV